MADIDHLTELFAPLGGVTLKRMFSGYGIMKDGMMFALISRDVLYLRTDDAAAARHRAEGALQWTPHMRGNTITTMPYWQLPERLLDEPEEFVEWAREAFAITKRHKAAQLQRKGKAAAKPNRAAAKKPAAKRKPAAKPKAKTAPKPGTKKRQIRAAVRRAPVANARRAPSGRRSG
jgi:DNA transformation protein